MIVDCTSPPVAFSHNYAVTIPLSPQRQFNTQTTTSNFTRMSHYPQPPSYEMAQQQDSGGYFVRFPQMLPAPMHIPCPTRFSQQIHTQVGATHNLNILKKPSSRQPQHLQEGALDFPNFKPADDKQEPVILAKCFSCQSYNSETYTMATLFKNKIFVGSLTQFITASDLVDFFQKFGVVTEAKVVMDEKGTSRGYGFVTFADIEAVNKILSAGSIFICGQRVAVASAIRKKHPDEA